MTSKKVQEIERAFCRLLRKMEFKKITASRICSEAGVSRATFYTYFESTQALLEEIEDRTLADILEIHEEWKYFNFKSLMEGQVFPEFIDVCRYCYNHREVFQALFGPYGDQDFVYRYESHIYRGFLRQVETVGDIRFPELVASSCAGAIIGMSRTWFADINIVTPEEMARLRTAVVFQVIKGSDQFSKTIRPERDAPAVKQPDEKEREERQNWRSWGQFFESEHQA